MTPHGPRSGPASVAAKPVASVSLREGSCGRGGHAAGRGCRARPYGRLTFCRIRQSALAPRHQPILNVPREAPPRPSARDLRTLGVRQLQAAFELFECLHNVKLVPFELPSLAHLLIRHQVDGGLDRMKPSHFDPHLP